MPQTGEARSWWADVEHVRKAIERRREAEERAGAARAERHLSIVDSHDGGAAHGTGRRAADRHGIERHSGDRHSGDGRAGDRHSGDGRAGDRRAGERRSGERHAAGPRTAELRAVERRTGERRGAHRSEPRRTVEITGRTVPAPAVPRSAADLTVAYGARGSSRRPSLSPADRLVHRPDRIAMWAVVLGFVLIVVAATSA
jgi:hypothetical protein